MNQNGLLNSEYILTIGNPLVRELALAPEYTSRTCFQRIKARAAYTGTKYFICSRGFTRGRNMARKQISRSLSSYLNDRVGDQLRGVAHYREDDFTVVYLRDDIREHRHRDEIDQMLTRIKQEGTANEEQSFPFGHLHATLRIFDETIFMHLPIENLSGVVVALEPEVALKLNSFVGDCLEHIYEQYPFEET